IEAATETAPPPYYPKPILASAIPLPPLSRADETAEEQNPASLQAHNEQIVTVDVDFDRLSNEPGGQVGVIRVAVEETLGHYAEWADVRTQQIRRLNKLRYGDTLHLHQKIRIPLQHVDALTFRQNRYEYHKRLQEDFYAVYRVGELQPYRVQRGDNYWTLCRDKFQIPMWLLKHSNPQIDLADLRFHQQLMIPTIEKASMNDAPGLDAENETDSAEPETQAGI
ncbi:MAG: LysM peptidoglycan-binding domain-containing protein, partial [Desulfatitalea sp.]|nr:LysM peptidoglycan-binding domain-containing protein [Desulfatitalea sp.]NNK00507.1 LysM peptidoglycan-binding domain-containing protein [Desulfatitalea sp.]